MRYDFDMIRTGCETLARKEPALAAAYSAIGVPDWRLIDADFNSLARIVTFQLLSTRAAAAIWARLQNWAGGTIHPEQVIAADADELRQCGLSRPKVQHFKSIATAIADKQLCFDHLASLPDAEARKQLVSVKGIGPWAADVFLMSAYIRLDVFPKAVVGLMEAFRILNGDPERPSARAFTLMAERWSPYRSVAAHLLWGYINFKRNQSY